MRTTDIKQRTALNGFHTRKQRNAQRTYVPVNGQLPPADALAAIGAPAEILEQAKTFHNLIVRERDLARKAAAAHAAAETAALTYKRTVRETIAADGDPAKVKDDTAKHKAVAETHAQFSADARGQRERLGHALGPQIQAIAADLFAPAEDEIEKSAAVLREALAGIRATWDNYSAAFQLRQWLSHVALDGGSTAAYHGATSMPREVAEALNALDHKAAEVDALKSDEQQVRQYRIDNGGAA